jgi:hypothetical protein
MLPLLPAAALVTVTRPVVELIVAPGRVVIEYVTVLPSGSTAVNWMVPPVAAMLALVGATVNAGAVFPLVMIVAVPMVPVCVAVHVPRLQVKSCELLDRPNDPLTQRVTPAF